MLCGPLSVHTKPGSTSGLWVQTRVRAPAGRACPRRIPLFTSFPISSPGEELPAPSPPAPLPHSPPPFRSLPVGAESSPKQDQVPRLPVRKSRQGSAEQRERGAQQRRKSQRIRPPPGGSSPRRSRRHLHREPGPRPWQQSSPRAGGTFATQSKWERARHAPGGLRWGSCAFGHFPGRPQRMEARGGERLPQWLSGESRGRFEIDLLRRQIEGCFFWGGASGQKSQGVPPR